VPLRAFSSLVSEMQAYHSAGSPFGKARRLLHASNLILLWYTLALKFAKGLVGFS